MCKMKKQEGLFIFVNSFIGSGYVLSRYISGVHKIGGQRNEWKLHTSYLLSQCSIIGLALFLYYNTKDTK